METNFHCHHHASASLLAITPTWTFDLGYHFISVIQNSDSGTFRPVAIIIVKIAKKLTHMDHIRSVASNKERVCMGQKSESVSSLPTVNS